MSKDYDPIDIEQKWQKKWQDDKLYTAPDKVKGKENEYILVEFAYPSGNLHAGHWYAFSVPDMYARYRRMCGKNVMFPMGFDAFGLPAENAAIKNKINPREWTFNNIDYMRKQLRSMGASFDWSREVVTASPEYYKWTQWLFLQLFNKGLAYQAETPVNWCPVDKTVLANEQVVNGKCERCGSLVEQRNMKQWQLRITDYADRLVDDLDKLDWPEAIKSSQKNWIGRGEGAEIEFALKNISGQEDGKHKVQVFTTRPDTIFGATFLAISPGLARKWLEVGWQASSEVKGFVEDELLRQKKLGFEVEKEKRGIDTGIRAVNPANQEEIPVWVVNYVLSDVGTGAIMGVPADDDRDMEFAEKFSLPIVKDYPKAGFEDFGKRIFRYKLRDWVVSRQRYWGCPIPVIHCEKCGVVPVRDEDLPIVLPELEDYLPSDDGQSPLAKAKDWVSTKCPKCDAVAKRDTDTLDTFVDSSWYFLRYTDPNNDKQFADKDKLESWMPVSFYSGGAEHTTMHLLYSRFFHKALFDLGLVHESEPYIRRMNRGIILGPDGQKMSKSRGNVIDPDDYVQRLGADTVRTYLAFIGPYNEVGHYPWSPDSIVGVRRFLERVWNLKDKLDQGKVVDNIFHKTVKDVTESLDKMKMNTAVPALMIFVNAAHDNGVTKEQYETLLKLLAPFAPHVTEEIWETLGHKTSIHMEKWPEFDPKKLILNTVTLAVQVNGKVRASLTLDKGESEESIKEKAVSLPAVEKWLEGKKVEKIIVVPGKIVSIVT